MSMDSRWNLIVVLLACLVAPLRGQDLVRPEAHPGGILIVVKDKSGLASDDQPLFLASNHVGWNPGDPSMKLSGRSDLRWQIFLPRPEQDSTLQFKFTRGSWETVEVDADLGDIDNRTLPDVQASELEPGKPVVVELEIERFADEREGAPRQSFRSDSTRPIEATGDVRRLQVVGGAGDAAGSTRDVLVWLPPGYHDEENANRRYPVLYMQDGQNVFDHRPPTPAEWGADETATTLIEVGEIEPIIIAAIPNSGPNRTREYLVGAAMGVEGEGDEYLDWLVREVVPRVERAVRADSDPEKRGIGGSSLGGLLALRAGHSHADVFGRVLAESPSILIRGEPMAIGAEYPWGPLTFIGFGDSEGVDILHVYKFHSLIRGLAGPERGDRVVLELGEGAGHDEHAWAERLPDALRFLYPPSDN